MFYGTSSPVNFLNPYKFNCLINELMFECLKNVGRLFEIILEISAKTNDF